MFFRQGIYLTSRQCDGRLESTVVELPTEKIVRRNILSIAYRQNYVAQKLSETLKYRRMNELGHITECAT